MCKFCSDYANKSLSKVHMKWKEDPGQYKWKYETYCGCSESEDSAKRHLTDDIEKVDCKSCIKAYKSHQLLPETPVHFILGGYSHKPYGHSPAYSCSKTACGLLAGFGDHQGTRYYNNTRKKEFRYTDNPDKITCKTCKKRYLKKLVEHSI